MTAEQVGSTIDRYKLLEQIGEGGFGTVYLAEQREPVRRRVALKIIKPGMDTRQVIARFEAERQALALMEHPHIARVLDAGATASERPYFVMELVRGEPITKFCDHARLDTRRRLELFIDVCRAVQHAHQKGIIHRDLKPSNVLVTEQDGVIAPRVIDFGIAKATDRELTERTLVTEANQFIGTPEYMSPEQAVPSRLDVDTRSDIYSLGVMLYELLTGCTPFADLRSQALFEIQRIIRDEEPSRPSTRVSDGTKRRTAESAGPPADDIARQRQTDAPSLARSLRGDLDWIVMKCLEKDRSRRYRSADELADDVRRHLDDRPVIASPPGAGYRARKFARRHRVGLAGAVALLIAFATGVGGLVQGYVTTVRERDEKESALAEAQRQTAIATAISDFLNNDLLRAADPTMAAAGALTVEEAMDAAAERIEYAFPDEPVVEASIRLTLTETYAALGVYDKARVHLDAAAALLDPLADPDSEPAMELASAEGSLRYYEGDLEGASEMLTATLARRERVLGLDHPDTVATRVNVGHLRQALGAYEEAEGLFRQVLASHENRHGGEHPSTLDAAFNVATCVMLAGRYADAETLYAETLATQRRALGDTHWDTINTMIGLGELYREIERDDECERLFVEAKQRMADRGTSEEHPRMIALLNNLALLYLYTGRFAEAEAIYLSNLEVGRRVEGERHPGTASTMHNLGGVYFSTERWDQAGDVVGQALELRQDVLGTDHPQTLMSQGLLARIYWKQGRFPEAAPLMIATWQGMVEAFGDEHPYTTVTAERVAGIYGDWGKPEKAMEWAAKAGDR